VEAGNVGINLGVAAPLAQFPFSGWKGSFFGDLHAQGRDAVEFYTDKKVVIDRWPDLDAEVLRVWAAPAAPAGSSCVLGKS